MAQGARNQPVESAGGQSPWTGPCGYRWVPQPSGLLWTRSLMPWGT